MKKQIVVIPGDGIGTEITQQSVRILHAIADVWMHEFEFTYRLMGADAKEKTGSYLPEETIASCKNSDAILMGAAWQNEPDNTATGGVETDRGLSELKKELEVIAEIWPVSAFLSLYHLSPLKAKHIQGLDLLIISAANESGYREIKGKPTEPNHEPDEITNTKKRIEQVVQLGFQYAQRHNKKLTLIRQANPVAGSGLWKQMVVEIAEQYPGIAVSDMPINKAITEVILNPQQFDVILADNHLFGNILSEEAGTLTGATGLLPWGSVGNNTAVFGATQKDYLQGPGRDIANPIGSVLSAAMLLDYLGMEKEAAMVREAVSWILKNNFVTRDIDPVNFYLTSTIGDLIVEYISNKVPEEPPQNDNDLRKSTII